MDIQELINTLNYIANTLTCLQKHADEIGGKLDGQAAIRLSENPHHLRDKAQQVLRELPEDLGELSDGYHTFNELYYHRMVLFSVICNTYKEHAWKSKLHADGSMYKDYFIVGLETNKGNYTYHYHLDYWNMFKVKELEKAPEWDGHKPSDITRLFSLLGEK